MALNASGIFPRGGPGKCQKRLVPFPIRTKSELVTKPDRNSSLVIMQGRERPIEPKWACSVSRDSVT